MARHLVRQGDLIDPKTGNITVRPPSLFPTTDGRRDRHNVLRRSKAVLWKALKAAEAQLDAAEKDDGKPLSAKDLSTLIRTCYVIAEHLSKTTAAPKTSPSTPELPDPWDEDGESDGTDDALPTSDVTNG